MAPLVGGLHQVVGASPLPQGRVPCHGLRSSHPFGHVLTACIIAELEAKSNCFPRRVRPGVWLAKRPGVLCEPAPSGPNGGRIAGESNQPGLAPSYDTRRGRWAIRRRTLSGFALFLSDLRFGQFGGLTRRAIRGIMDFVSSLYFLSARTSQVPVLSRCLCWGQRDEATDTKSNSRTDTRPQQPLGAQDHLRAAGDQPGRNCP
jgi:hypothetical protein